MPSTTSKTRKRNAKSDPAKPYRKMMDRTDAWGMTDRVSELLDVFIADLAKHPLLDCLNAASEGIDDAQAWDVFETLLARVIELGIAGPWAFDNGRPVGILATLNDPTQDALGIRDEDDDEIVVNRMTDYQVNWANRKVGESWRNEDGEGGKVIAWEPSETNEGAVFIVWDDDRDEEITWYKPYPRNLGWNVKKK